MTAARRLYDLLDQISRLNADSTSWQMAWSTATGISSKHLMSYMPTIIGLYTDTIADAMSRPFNHRALLVHQPTWRRAVLMNDVSWQSTMTQSGFVLHASAVGPLYTLAELLATGDDPEPVTVEAKASAVSNAIDSLRTAIKEADDLDRDVREFLWRHVQEMDDAMASFSFAGETRVRRATEGFVADATIKPGLFARMQASSVARNVAAVYGAATVLLGAYNSTSVDVATAIENTKAVVSILSSGEQKAIETGIAPKAIEAGSGPTELPSTETSAGGNNLETGD